MDKLKLEFDGKALSLNEAQTVGCKKFRSRWVGFLFKSKKYKSWAPSIQQQLIEQQQAIKTFAKHFAPEKYALLIHYIFLKKDLYVKSGPNKGKISQRSGDWDNLPKPLQDLIFNDLSLFNPEMNDCHITSGLCLKVPYTSDKIIIEIKKVSHEEYFNWSSNVLKEINGQEKDK